MPNKTAKKIYNHGFDVSFCLENEHENPGNTPKGEIIKAMQARVDYLRSNPGYIMDAVDNIFDTYEVDPKFAKKPEPELAKYIIEEDPVPTPLGISDWGHISEYLKQDPRPEYRLVSLAVINGTARLVWERLK